MTSEAEENWAKGFELYVRGEKTESISYFRSAADLRGNLRDLECLEDNLADLGRREEALPFFRRAVEKWGSAMAYHGLGRINCRLGRYEEALLHLEKAAKMFKKEKWNREHDNENNYWLGRTLFESERYEEAIPYLKKAVTLADEWNNPQWLPNCQQVFRLCLDRVGDKATELLRTVTLVSKTHWLKRLLFGGENKHWQSALQSDTVGRYIEFFYQYPESVHAAAAKSKIRTLRGEEYKLMDAMLRVTRSYAQGDKFFIPGPSLTPTERGYILTLSVHLLKDFAPKDTDPRVRGSYGSREALYSFARTRIAEIYRIVFTSAGKLKLREVVVNCYHGARHSFTTADFPTLIYSVSISGQKLARFDWGEISNEDIQKAWSVREDKIPDLGFG